MKYISRSLGETHGIAKKLVKSLREKPLLLNGDLGAGKTTLVKYLALELGIKELVTSPTFNKMNIYKNLIHIDAYHIKGTLEEYEDYFENKPLVIEWSDNLVLDFEKYLKVNVYLNNDEHIYEIVEDK